MKTVIFAASQYGMKCIEAIRNMESIKILGIVTTPVEYELKYGINQKKKMNNPIYYELKSKCVEWEIPVYEIDSMNSKNTIDRLRLWNPEIIVVSGWYHLIGNKILKIPKKGVIGLHSSLLPKYKGGAPLVWQIINGEKKTGITLFYISNGIDAGDIIAQKGIDIQFEDTIKTLYDKVGEKGIELLIEYLPLLDKNCAPRIKQEETKENEIYPQRSPEDGIIDWNQEAESIYNFVRAQTKPYPGAYCYYNERMIKIWSCKLIEMKKENEKPGTIIEVDQSEDTTFPIIATGSKDKVLKILECSLVNNEYKEKELIWEKGTSLR